VRRLSETRCAVTLVRSSMISGICNRSGNLSRHVLEAWVALWNEERIDGEMDKSRICGSKSYGGGKIKGRSCSQDP